MGYTVPLRFVRITRKRSDNRQSDVSICATRIVAIMSTDMYQARKIISDERKNGTLINGCGLAKAKSAIFLDNGSVVSSPFSVTKLMSMIDKSLDVTQKTKRPKTYDVFASEIEEDEDELVEECDNDDEFEDFE